MEITPSTNDIANVTGRQADDVFFSVHGANRDVPRRWFEGDDIVVDAAAAVDAALAMVGPGNDMVWVELHCVGSPVWASRMFNFDPTAHAVTIGMPAMVRDGGWAVWVGDEFQGRKDLADILHLMGR